MCEIDIKLAKLPYNLKVRTLTSDQCLITSTVYKNCEILIGKRKLLGDLISLAIKGYDVILGMDWLVEYDAQFDCKRKVMEFRISREAILRLDVRVRLASSVLISKIWVRKLLSKECRVF